MNFNLLSVRLFAAALRSQDSELARSLASDIKYTGSLIPVIEPEKEYNEESLAEDIVTILDKIEQGNVNMNWNVYIPQVHGLVSHYLNTDTEQSNGKTDSELSDI